MNAVCVRAQQSAMFARHRATRASPSLPAIDFARLTRAVVASRLALELRTTIKYTAVRPGSSAAARIRVAAAEHETIVNHDSTRRLKPPASHAASAVSVPDACTPALRASATAAAMLSEIAARGTA